jgi:KipI family sensor histidine kinase inhibitor
VDRVHDIDVLRFGERALLLRVPDQARVHALATALLADLAAGRLDDVVPGDRTLLLTFDGTDSGERAARTSLAAAERRLDQVGAAATDPAPRHRVIPVRYGGSDGPDLVEAAALAGCSPQELVQQHAGRDYTVQFLGFAPGFPYCGDLPDGLVVPRLATPRTATRAGSVAIAERYTGIYPASLPGGWRVIGWTPVVLFDPAADPPTYLLPGDTVRFEGVEGAELPAAPYRPPDWSA